MILNSCYSHRGGVSIPKVGDTVAIGGIDYLVVHIDETNRHMYFAKKYTGSTYSTQFGSDTTYNGSAIHNTCKTYYTEEIPDTIKPLLVTLDCGHGCPVFIPTLEQVASTTLINSYYGGTGLWSYFDTNEKRKLKTVSGAEVDWFLQTPWPSDPSSLVCYALSTGVVIGQSPKTKPGFRPCFAMDMSALVTYSQFEAWKSIL